MTKIEEIIFINTKSKNWYINEGVRHKLIY